MAQVGQSLQGVVLTDIQEIQIKATDALLLAQNGLVIPTSQVYYDDDDIQYDIDIDDIQWSKEYSTLSWEEKQAQYGQPADDPDRIAIQIKTDNTALKQWLLTNEEKVQAWIIPLLQDLYEAETTSRS